MGSKEAVRGGNPPPHPVTDTEPSLSAGAQSALRAETSRDKVRKDRVMAGRPLALGNGWSHLE